MATLPHLLLVDDDLDTLELTRGVFASEALRVTATDGVGEALAVLSRERVDCVLSDVYMPGSDGFALLEALKSDHPDVPVVLHTGYGNLDDAVRATGRGAAAYLPKPAKPQELREAVRAALERAAAQRRTAPKDASAAEVRGAVVGRSAAIVALYGMVARAAGSTAPVLIRGETGTGKEWVARSIHRYGPRAQAPFVAVNCSALHDGTLESELFGHARGSFTGAASARKGLLQTAHGGTLFLDEVGELPARVQAELLRVLQEGELRAVGADEVTKIDVRVVAATHRDLDRMVTEGSFREDLLFRLRVVELVVPPLRERRDDIELLAEHFLAHSQGGVGRRFAPETLEVLRHRDWPGNVRELQSAVHRAAALASGEVVLPRDLPPVVREGMVTASTGNREPLSLTALWEQVLAQGIPTLDELELSYVRAVVTRLRGNKTQAAEVLAVDRKTIRRILARGGDDSE